MRRAALAAVVATALAGCGSSTLSTRELRAQATLVCQRAHAQTNRIATPASPGGGRAFLSRGIAVLKPELRALRGLQAPRDLAHVYATALSAFTDKLAALRATARALDAGADPVIATRALQLELAPLESREAGAWTALEIPACQND